MRAPLVRARCESCQTLYNYVHPWFGGEHAYGEFVLYGQTGGNVHAYLLVLEGPGQQVWNYVDSLIPHQTLITPETVARLADPINGHRLTMESVLVCPICGSPRAIDTTREPAGMIDLPDTTFWEFLGLPEPLQRERVIATAREVEAAGLGRLHDSTGKL